MGLIQKAGGWLKFSQSSAPLSWQDIDPSTGEQTTRRGTQAEYAQFVLDRLNPADKSAINARSGEQVLLRDQKDRYLNDEKQKAVEFFQKREAQFKSQQEDMANSQKQLDEKYKQWAEQVVKEQDFLKDMPVPEKATEAEKKHIAETNAELGKIRDYIRAQGKTTSFEGYTDLVMNAAKGQIVDRMIKWAKGNAESKDKKIAELEAELTKVRSAGRSVPKGGSLTGSGDTTVEPSKKKAVDSADEIMKDFDEFAARKASE